MTERIHIRKKSERTNKRPEDLTNEEAFACDWTRECEVCDAKPVVNATGLCGPCTWGESETAGGNW